jgi:hypothetical protein
MLEKNRGHKCDACTVRLTSIHLLQIEGNFTKTSGGLTNLFYGCVD